jgi:ryanodine receptor 2
MPAYTPKPIDTAAVTLTPDQNELIEQLAKNAHETWAAKRLTDGWTLGKNRDDAKKHHPCLIPYEQLPESEKAYDREIVTQTIKAAIALGYKLSHR